MASDVSKRELRRLRREERAAGRPRPDPQCTMCRSEARRGRIIVAVDSNLHLCEECIDTLAAFVAECRTEREGRTAK